jgi:hypothetical protein
MTSKLSPQKGAPGDEKTSSESIQANIYPYQYEINIADGSEFLDDAIRMKDQPLEESSITENE